jgi:hypothetical protein
MMARLGVLLLVVVAVGSFEAGAVTNAEGDPRPLTLSLTAIPVANGGCGHCQNCFGGHSMDATGTDAWHECWPGVCGAHPPCGSTEGDDDAIDFQDDVTYAALARAAREGDVAALRRFLAESPRQLRLNADRSSVQVTNCGVLHTNFPLSAEVVGALTASE